MALEDGAVFLERHTALSQQLAGYETVLVNGCVGHATELDAAPPVLVPEWQTGRECRWLARHTGLLAGGPAGTVPATVRRRGASIDPGATIAGIVPDLGERYLSSVYDDSWVIDRGLGQALQEEPPTSKGPLDVLV